MSIVVSLRDVVNEIDVMSDEEHAYINKITGELVTLTSEEIEAIEEGTDWSKFPEWQQEILSLAQKVSGSPDYLPLPSKFDIHEYAIMEMFCYSIENSRLSDELANQIRGSGAFRRFRDAIQRNGIENEWYQFRNQALEEKAINWLDENGIAYSRG
jgi:hypothetical protein